MTPPFKACVDIGGTKVAVALADAQSEHCLQLYAHRSEATVRHGEPDALVQQIIRMVDSCCLDAAIAPEQLAGIGVSSCGPFVQIAGKLAVSSPNICGGLAGAARGLPNTWMHAPLQALLERRFAKVRIENDAVSALEAERRWGALQGIENCAYVTWSTGIGVGLCVDGRVLRGKNGNAGHAGHMFVSDNNDALCGCGNVGDVEGLVAGNAIERRFGLVPKTLFSSGQYEDVVDALCKDLGRMLYNLVVTLDLERISLGGSVFWHHQDHLLPKLQAQISGNFPALTDTFSLVPAGLGTQVGNLGALALLN